MGYRDLVESFKILDGIMFKACKSMQIPELKTVFNRQDVVTRNKGIKGDLACQILRVDFGSTKINY